jgi:hypothetical protein
LRDLHELDGPFEERVPVPGFSIGGYSIALTVILGVKEDSFFLTAKRIDFDLDLSIGIDCNIEYLSISCEPGISPSPIITDSDRSNAVDDANRTGLSIGHGNPPLFQKDTIVLYVSN